MKIAALNAFRWVLSKADHIADGVTKELSENRVLLCWVYAAAYLALIFYCAVVNPASHNVAIMTTGGIVGTIFSVYVLSQSSEKKVQMKIDSEADEPPAEGEHGASD